MVIADHTGQRYGRAQVQISSCQHERLTVAFPPHSFSCLLPGANEATEDGRSAGEEGNGTTRREHRSNRSSRCLRPFAHASSVR